MEFPQVLDRLGSDEAVFEVSVGRTVQKLKLQKKGSESTARAQHSEFNSLNSLKRDNDIWEDRPYAVDFREVRRDPEANSIVHLLPKQKQIVHVVQTAGCQADFSFFEWHYPYTPVSRYDHIINTPFERIRAMVIPGRSDADSFTALLYDEQKNTTTIFVRFTWGEGGWKETRTAVQIQEDRICNCVYLQNGLILLVTKQTVPIILDQDIAKLGGLEMTQEWNEHNWEITSCSPGFTNKTGYWFIFVVEDSSAAKRGDKVIKDSYITKLNFDGGGTGAMKSTYGKDSFPVKGKVIVSLLEFTYNGMIGSTDDG